MILLPRVAAQDAAESEIYSLADPVFFYGLFCVLRARRIKDAARISGKQLEGGYIFLIYIN